MSASTEADSSFVRLLASSDRPTREKAFHSLEIFLTADRTFTYIELLKIWKGLFFCLHHTANPLPQQRLSKSLASLLLALPRNNFIPFLSAFYQTIISYWPSIPALRLDKYLYLIRLYISHTFSYLSQQAWSQPLVDEWVALMQGRGRCQGVLDLKDEKVGDGLRYHVMDVWIDGLVEARNWEDHLAQGILKPVESVIGSAGSKPLKERASKIFADDRIKHILNFDGLNEGEKTPLDDEFDGFD